MATTGHPSASRNSGPVSTMNSSQNSNSKSISGGNRGQQALYHTGSLLQKFPVNSLQELKLTTGEKISGRVYCTDEMSRSIVIQTALVHTTLSTELRIISADYVASSTLIPENSESVNVAATPLTQPLPKIHKKVLEDRERRAIRLAEESLRHINQNASAVGQAVFDRLLKACGEVVWAPGDTASILVLNQIQVDAPYEPANCKIISKGGPNGFLAQGGLAESSLDRVRKIVASTSTQPSPKFKS